MKKIIAIMALQVLFFGLYSQNSFNCLSHEIFKEQLHSNVAFRDNQNLLEKETQNFEALSSHQKPSSATYILPIVFHIIYTTANGNISDAQIKDQVQILNKEFNRLQPDTAFTPLPFKALAAPFNVEFRLANIDPNGDCTTGIEHIYNTMAACSFSWDAVKAISDWPNNKYVNIWLIESMRYPGVPGCGGGGYSTFPGGLNSLDGIVMRSDLIGSIGTAQTSSWGNWKGRYLIHELGHWFNLRHIWGDAPCGNDLVSDTPTAVFSNSNCPTFPHNPNGTCAGSNADGEMFTDYMDYSDGSCLNMFSAGQVVRMTAAINSAVSGRNNLWSASNLVATGTSNPYTYPGVCGAVPEILPHEPVFACAGDSVKITDVSYGGASSSRLWSFPGGTAANTSDSMVWVKYPGPGVYSVVLTKNFPGSTKTQTFTNRICVSNPNPNSNYSFPFSESFENQSQFDSNWRIINHNKDTTTWKLTKNTSFTGYSCLGIMNFDMPAPLSDDAVSPSYDLSSVDSPTLSFRLFFAGKVTENFDKLQVYISKNCGKTWTPIYQKVATNVLKTVPTDITFSYYPYYGSSEWRLEKVNINKLDANGIVNFKFSFTSGGGNNIFIDDLNIDGVNTVGLAKQANNSPFYLYPNPANSEVHLGIGSCKSSPMEIAVNDLSGRKILSKMVNVHEGEEVVIDTQGIKEGVYFLMVKQEQTTINASKLIISKTE